MRYGKMIAGLIAAWLAFALSAAAKHLFTNDADRIGAAVALAAVVPILVFALWYATSYKFRQFALSLSPRNLTLLQSWRIFGFIFVLLEARGILPAVFALPAGYGDMAIGATASIVAFTLATAQHRSSFILWQLLGIADLVVAVSLGATAVLLDPHGPSTVPMTALPLSLIPTFIVPLLLICHLICIAQATAWKRVSSEAHHSGSPCVARL